MSSRQFVRALFQHYGPDLPFTAAAALNKPRLRALAPEPSETGLDRWFADHAVADLGGLTVLPVPDRGHRESQSRRLWRVVGSSGNDDFVDAAVAALEAASGEPIEKVRSWTRHRQGVRRRSLIDAVRAASAHADLRSLSAALERGENYASQLLAQGRE
jgi:hypothetical protein